MVPRKKRKRYIWKALKVCDVKNIEIDITDWNQVWDTIDRWGHLVEEPARVYAIVDHRNKLVKFGKSKFPIARLKELKTGNGNRLLLAGFCIESERISERSIHDQLSSLRVTGEWFELNEKSQDVIYQIRREAGIS